MPRRSAVAILLLLQCCLGSARRIVPAKSIAPSHKSTYAHAPWRSTRTLKRPASSLHSDSASLIQNRKAGEQGATDCGEGFRCCKATLDSVQNLRCMATHDTNDKKVGGWMKSPKCKDFKPQDVAPGRVAPEWHHMTEESECTSKNAQFHGHFRKNAETEQWEKDDAKWTAGRLEPEASNNKCQEQQFIDGWYKTDPNLEWLERTEIDRGAYGLIEKTRKFYAMNACYEGIANDGDCYVMKKALSLDGRAEINAEIGFLTRVAECPGVVTLVDAAPCIGGPGGPAAHPLKGAFVMPMMIPNLWKYYDKVDSAVKVSCRDTIQQQLADALQCSHDKGVVHGDFKGDQVLYRDKDELGCPIGLTISDFGLSGLKDDTVEKFTPDDYMYSGHIVGAMFKDGPGVKEPRDPLGLSIDEGHFRMTPEGDWCAFMYEMANELNDGDTTNDWFQVTLSVPEAYREMDCGWMGGELEDFTSRNMHLIAPRKRGMRL